MARSTASSPTSSGPRSPWRALLAMLALVVVLVAGLASAVTWKGGQWTPKLGLDLEGGTQMILQPQVRAGESVNAQQLAQAVDIMRARVDGQGVAEAEVSTLGDNVVVAVPGKMSKAQEEALRQSSQMRFRPVITYEPAKQAQATPAPTGSTTPQPSGTATTRPSGTATQGATSRATATPKASASSAPAVTSSSGKMNAGRVPAAPSPSPTPTPSTTPGAGLPRANAADGTPVITDEVRADPKKLAEAATSEKWLTQEWQAKLAAYDCAKQPAYDPTAENPNLPIVACDDDGSAKYLLGPSVMSGDQLADASSGVAQNNQGQATGGYVVNLQVNGATTAAYAAISGYMAALQQPRNQLAVVLDNEVVSAPYFKGAIADGRAQIEGNFTAESAKRFADQLKFGALPISFSVQSTETISPTIGGDQLTKGLLAGGIGLLLVVIYSLFQYRALGLVTVASLVAVGVLTYLTLTLFGWGYNLRLTMAGVTGAIVAIGTTADSFIVYFERVRDEIRDGRRLQAAVQTGWERAKRTILISDGVNFLAAAVLYLLASSNVRGFAFVLMLTTALDVIVTFLFTHPLLQLLARTRFFGDGHRWSGFDPATLGAKVRYMGRGRLMTHDPARPVGATAPRTEGAR